jgi:hypothetical protein
MPYSIQTICFVPTVTLPAGLVVNLPRHRGGSDRVVLSTAARGAPTASHNSPCSSMPRRGSPEEGIGVVALSLDETSPRRFIGRHGSTFPVGPSADGPHVRELTGAFATQIPFRRPASGYHRTGGWWSVCISAASSGDSRPRR